MIHACPGTIARGFACGMTSGASSDPAGETGVRKAGFVVLYRWRLKPQAEAEFVAAWTRITERFCEEHGSLGSRLHRGDDGRWYAYAQWPSDEHRRRALAAGGHTADSAVLRAAALESFPEVRLEPVVDLLR